MSTTCVNKIKGNVGQTYLKFFDKSLVSTAVVDCLKVITLTALKK